MATAWHDISYFGKKQKRYYKFLDTILMRLLKQAVKENGKLDAELFDQIIKLTGRQNQTGLAIAKMYSDVSIQEDMKQIKCIIDNVSPEVLQEAVKNTEWEKRASSK